MFDKNEIKRIIETELPDCTAIVHNEYEDGEHFEAQVVSTAFEGKNLIKQHQLVYKALGDLMSGAIHALALKTYTPEKWPHS